MGDWGWSLGGFLTVKSSGYIWSGGLSLGPVMGGDGGRNSNSQNFKIELSLDELTDPLQTGLWLT